MNSIFENRALLLNAMENALKSIERDAARPAFAKLNDIIRNDEDKYLSIHSYLDFQISYSRERQDRFIPHRRVITTLQKYLQSYNLITGILCATLDWWASKIWLHLCDEVDISDNIKLLTATNITNHYKDCHNVAYSCMTGPAAAKVSIYAINPEKVSLVVMGSLRALLWTTDDGKKVLDRIYPVGHWLVPILENWATKRGFITRSTKKGGYKSIVELNDNSIRSVTLRKFFHNGKAVYPYADTFAFISKMTANNITLSNHFFGAKKVLYGTYGHSYIIYGICSKCLKTICIKQQAFSHMKKTYCEGCIQFV